MKFLIASALATTLGLGWFGTRTEAAAFCDPCCPAEECCTFDECEECEDCNVTVECGPDDTCLVECTAPNGDSCWAVYACDGLGGCELIESGGDCCEGSCGE